MQCVEVYSPVACAVQATGFSYSAPSHVYLSIIAALVVLLCSGRALSAQPIANAFVRPGDRVRVRATTDDMASMGEYRVGVLQRVHRDSVTVDWTSGARETLPLSRISRLDVSEGSGNDVGRGMGYGFLSGAIAGASYGIVRGHDGGEYSPPVVVVTAISIVGGLVGSVAGGLVGAALRRERWTRVRLEQPLRRVALTPYMSPAGRGTSRAGVEVGVRF